MSGGRILRKIWHDLYYRFATDKMVNFAMRCKDFAGQVDLESTPLTFLGRFRLAFHRSLCQGCQNYLDASLALKKAVKTAVADTSNPQRLERLNVELTKKHSRKDSSGTQ
jgi:hypothetical protein